MAPNVTMALKSTQPQIRQFDDVEALSCAAADQVCRVASDAIATQARGTIVLAGGSTPRRLYEVLATPAYLGKVPWKKIEFFWGDERMVPPQHRDSNFQMAYTALLSRIFGPQEHVHRIPTECGVPEVAARRYEGEIARAFGIAPGAPPPSFDLILLGLGTDGHTASLFPNTEALDATTRWVVANRGPLPHVERVTMTAGILNAARHVIFLVTGPEKAAVLAQVLEGPCDFCRLPAQMIRPTSGDVTWYVDRAAASKLAQVTGNGGPDK